MSPTGVGTWLPVEPPVEIESLVANNPEYVALAVLAAILGGGLLWIAWRWYTRPPAAALKRTLAGADAVTILTHPNPDPDAMASALGIQRIAKWTGADTTIRYPGQIRHQQNRAFRNVLELDLDRIESVHDLDDDLLVLVDHNVARGFEEAEGVTADVIVDHHIGTGEGRAFTDIRTDYGATASIVTEYFRDLGAEKIGPEKATPDDGNLYLDSPVATGLLFGIQSDTNNLTTGCADVDFAASSYLFPIIAEEDLDEMANPPLTKEVLEVKARAIENLKTRGSFGITDVGSISDADAIPQAADEIMRLEGVTAVIVLGERDGTLHLSGRSRDARVHMGRALEAAVEEIPTASAGGHARMGGGQIPLEHLDGIGPNGGLTRDEFNDRIIRSLNGDL